MIKIMGAMDIAAELDSKTNEAIDSCALRFDGYAYEDHMRKHKTRPHGNGDDGKSCGYIRSCIGKVVRTRCLHESMNDNFCAFFGLQRYLGKWGGESLTPWTDDTLAYHFLFLHLYRLAAPEEFVLQDRFMSEKWNNLGAAEQEQVAARVRRSMRRVGEGPRSYYEPTARSAPPEGHSA